MFNRKILFVLFAILAGVLGATTGIATSGAAPGGAPPLPLCDPATLDCYPPPPRDCSPVVVCRGVNEMGDQDCSDVCPVGTP